MSFPNEILLPSNFEEFEKILSNYLEKYIIVDIYTDWCSPCKRFSPIFSEVHEMYKDKVIFAKVNLEEINEVGNKYKIASIPTVLFFKNGELIKQVIGAIQKGSFIELIENLIEK